MKILIGHNHYKMRGGEDAVAEAEYTLLKDFGQEVMLYERDNTEFDFFPISDRLKHLSKLDWSPRAYGDIKALIRKFRPDVAHFHNIFYMMTPAVYYACKEEGVPVIQSQHNFRIFCSNGLFYRDNRICEDCLDKSLRQGVYHGCYRNSRLLTAFVAAMLKKHWQRRTWLDMVDIYITATQFSRQKLIQGGIPAEKIVIKPNFVYPDPGMRRTDEGYALYVGRLSREKGIESLLEAWRAVPHFPLRIIGNGPLADSLKDYVAKHRMANVAFLGYVTREVYEENMKKARFLVVPSYCYENFPRVIVEASAYGVPVVSSNIGTLKELVQDNINGLVFDPRNSKQLMERIEILIRDPSRAQEMGKNARRIFEEKYSIHNNYKCLIEIYQKAIQAANDRLQYSWNN